ncbi:hypothetical protein [Streptomyces bauhiniae]|uniref:hypothetical protein n=1 Tax=Streptomyces bauhiniae TaxID=2340725 RepID=UPI0035DD6070
MTSQIPDYVMAVAGAVTAAHAVGMGALLSRFSRSGPRGRAVLTSKRRRRMKECETVAAAVRLLPQLPDGAVVCSRGSCGVEILMWRTGHTGIRCRRQDR